MAQPLRNQKKKTALFSRSIFQLGISKSATSALEREVTANTCSMEDVSSLCRQGRLKEALHILHVLDERIDSSTYLCLFQECIKKKSFSEGKLIHAHMNESGYTPDRSIRNTLVNMYAKFGSLVDARIIFNQMPVRDVFSWTVMIAAYARHGHSEEALALFYQMQQYGIQPNQFTFPSVLPACANLAALEQGMDIHEKIIRSGYQSDVFVANALVDMYAKCGNIKHARDVFDKMHERDVVSWTAMIAGYAQNGYVDEALELFQKMPQRNSISWNALIAGYAQNGLLDEARELFQKTPQRNVVSWTVMIAGYAKNGYGEEALKLFRQMQVAGVKPDSKTFASVLPACADLVSLEQGVKIHEEISRSGCQSDIFVANALVDMYAKCRSIEKARDLFDKMPERDVASWTVMISGHAQHGQVDEALKLFQKMPQQDVFSWNAMIAGYAQNGYVYEALKLFEQMPERDRFSWNAMTAGYAHNGYVDDAFKLFQEMPKRDVVSWTVMIAGYVQNGCNEEALKLFRQMQLEGLKPDSKTFASVLPACANLAALEQGMQIHQKVIRRGFQCDVFVANALVDMYSKCGSIEKARDMFDKMPKRDVVSWNGMIAGYGMHGYGMEALKLFEQMQHSDMKPNHVTLVCILSACCHAGLVDEGRRYFACMSEYYDITPAIEHYGCMVDLLGRAGHLDEAHDLINKMPIKPNATVWGCLLGACRIHNNIELGEYVAERLFELEPENPAPYVLLSNIYAAADRRDGIEKVRKMMKDRKVKKIPGCSWIEVNEEVHSFLIGD